MVTLSRIYTKTGDDGQTALGDGTRVDKHHPRVAAYGEVDELNSVLGLLLTTSPPEAQLLLSIQNELFDLGADLCVPQTADEAPDSCLRITPAQATRLERAIDRLNANLSPLRSFILPGGSLAASWCHLARTVCRRAEREVVALAKSDPVNPSAIIYLNRLSDLLFVLARVYNDNGAGDVLWQPGKTRQVISDHSENCMYTLSAFADEISPDPAEQVAVLSKCGVRHIELRSIHKTNVLDLTELQLSEFEALLKANGFALSAIGSPIGKVKIDAPFEPHLQRFQRAVELAKRFGTRNIRIFSYYPPGEAQDWNGVEEHWQREVFDRLGQQARIAEAAGVRLVHENEHRIFGDSPTRVVRLFEQVDTPALRAVYDAANYVFCGYDPWQGWLLTKALTVHFHIKDWKSGAPHGSLAGEGDGRWPDVIADARTYDGFATLEPHLLGGGPTGGHTGPDLFPKAIEAIRVILDKASVPHDKR